MKKNIEAGLDISAPDRRVIRVELPRHNLRNVALLTACLIALSSALFVAYTGIRMVTSDVTDIRGVEPGFVYSVQKLLMGRPLYTNPEKLYFDITEHSFLYPYTLFGLSRAVNLKPGDAAAVTKLGRTTSIVFESALSALLFLFCTRVLKIHPALSCMASSALFVLQAPWGFLARPDALLNTCVAASWCATATALQAKRPGAANAWLFMAALMGVLAFLAKQTGLQVIAATFLFLLLTRHWRHLALFTFTSVVCLLFVYAIKTFILGNALFQNTATSLHAGLDLNNAWTKVYRPLLMERGLGFILFGCILTTHIRLRSKADITHRFLVFVLGFTFAFAVLTSLRAGSAYHYFNDFLAVALVFIAAFLQESLYTSHKNGKLALGCILILVILCWLPPSAIQLHRDYPLDRDLFATRSPVAKWVQDALEQRPEAFCAAAPIFLDTGLG